MAIPQKKTIHTLTLVAGTVMGMIQAPDARADDRFWYWADSTSHETYFNGAFAAPAYWHGFSIPGSDDVIRFSQGLTAPGFPDPSFDNPSGLVPSTVYFGDFNHHSFLGNSHTHFDAVNASVSHAYIHNGSFEFNFGSGVGGWNPNPPPPSQGSLRITHGTFVGDRPYQSAELRIREGTLQSNGVAHVATEFGSSGAVDVSGLEAHWEVGAWMDLGLAGSGTLRVGDGSSVVVANAVYAGNRDGSSGYLDVSGGGKLTIGTNLTLGSGHDSVYGATHGSLNLSGSGSALLAHDVYVGGTGTGSAEVSYEAMLAATDLLRVGSLASVNTLKVYSGASATARRLWIGTQAGSVNNELMVNGRSSRLSIADEILIGSNGATGQLSVSGGGEVSGGDITVGDSGAFSFGSLSATGMDTTVRSAFTLTIGAGSTGPGASQGAVVASNGASIFVQNAINVGLTSVGTLTLSGGATAQSEFGRVARYAGSTGSATISGQGSRWDIASSMYVGGHSSTGQGGTGTLVVSNSGAVTAGQSLGTWHEGTVDVTSGGRIQVGAGDVTTVPSGAIRIGAGGVLFGDGTILGDVILSGGTISPGHSPGIMRVEGDLTLGSQGSLFMEIGGTSRDRYDGLIIASTDAIELGGVLVLSFIDGFAPREGEVFDLLMGSTNGSISGHFSAIDVQNLAPGWEYRMSIDSATHTLQVTSLNDGVYVPSPGAAFLIGLGVVARTRVRRYPDAPTATRSSAHDAAPNTSAS